MNSVHSTKQRENDWKRQQNRECPVRKLIMSATPPPKPSRAKAKQNVVFVECQVLFPGVSTFVASSEAMYPLLMNSLSCAWTARARSWWRNIFWIATKMSAACSQLTQDP